MSDTVYADINFNILSDYTKEQLQPIIDDVGQTFIDGILCNPDDYPMDSSVEYISEGIIKMIDDFEAKGYDRFVVEQIMRQVTVFVVENQQLMLYTEDEPTIN